MASLRFIGIQWKTAAFVSFCSVAAGAGRLPRRSRTLEADPETTPGFLQLLRQRLRYLHLCTARKHIVTAIKQDTPGNTRRG